MLRDVHINQGTLYLGKQAGKEIHEKIKSAKKSIKIVTPYISSDFVDLLKTKARSGLNVKLIVSSDIGGEKDKEKTLRKLISQKRHTNYKLKEKRRKLLKYIAVFFVILLLVTAFGGYVQSQFTWYVLPVFLVAYFIRKKLLSLRIYTYSYYSELALSIPMSPYTNGFNREHTLIHAKLFVIDEEVAYTGSVNFTKAGFWYNYESRVTLTEKNLIDKLSFEFTYLFSNSDTYHLNIPSMGQLIYAEPIN